jgi:hypothetical protein
MEAPSYADQIVRTFRDVNPHVVPVVPPRPDPASSGGPCSLTRVAQAGGAISQLLVHPSFVPFEQLYRKLPEQGVFTATAERNFVFELGAFEVPQQMAFLLLDYSFQIHRLSGAVAGDTVPLERERLATLLGYDVKINETRKGNLLFELDPQPISATQEAFAPQQTGGTIIGTSPTRAGIVPTFPSGSGPQPATPAQFAAANFQRVASPAGPGLSLLPQRPTRQGALDVPFTYVAYENQRVAFQVVIFKPIPIPLAFFEVDVTGMLVPQNVLADMFEGMKPCVSPGGGR